ncbi:lipopolysaccharide biosynthesis protein [Peribacillus sp. V2I11]|uniref:lipopolysaccharide biosynthesis protein n=1 Tax=Peribacillus sp. V2I11 TaxID=3042277 RepID=UPI002789264E|nr:lipopolysaccharide biosynthesis protein [Peribacillus sp. V2I11]MDQ0883020.1 O-antigen/teichoic acid export membrane protein [Peribacillus sp. V2I11]
MRNSLYKKIGNATKWSTITEILAKLVMPVSNIILARLLVPEAFGVVATVTMIVSFADMFTDAGFQKYLIQHKFKTEKALYDHTAVAFWTNLLLSIFIWMIIVIFATPLTNLIGSPGLEAVIIISCISLPLTSFSSIQMALYRRSFDYKPLFLTRMISICVPFVVTIPLTLLWNSYWALIIGTLCGNLTNAVILTLKSKWKPKAFYRLSILKSMISFSIWSLLESITVWLISWGDVFIIGTLLNSYYLGLYKTSMNTVNSIIALITSATVPILLATLSRLQDDEQEYQRMFFKFQRLVGVFVFPLGVGMFIYSDFITSILLGGQWEEASLFVGIWGLISAIAIPFSTYCGIVYISKGRPKVSFWAQILQLIVLIPVIYISANYSFTTLIYSRSLIRIEGFLVHFLIIYYVFKISPWKMIRNVMPCIVASIIMAFVAIVLQRFYDGFLWNIISILVCIVLYFGVIGLFRDVRNELVLILKYNKKKASSTEKDID